MSSRGVNGRRGDNSRHTVALIGKMLRLSAKTLFARVSGETARCSAANSVSDHWYAKAIVSLRAKRRLGWRRLAKRCGPPGQIM